VNTIPGRNTLPAEGLARIGLQKRSRLVLVHSNLADLDVLRQWVNEGKLRAYIDEVYPFIMWKTPTGRLRHAIPAARWCWKQPVSAEWRCD